MQGHIISTRPAITALVDVSCQKSLLFKSGALPAEHVISSDKAPAGQLPQSPAQLRVRVCVPLPQLTEQAEYEVHVVTYAVVPARPRKLREKRKKREI